jgi:hypothetical protein
MGCIAGDEDPAVAELVGDETAPEPVLLGKDLVLEALVDAEDGPDRPIAIDGLEIRLVGPQIVVNDPALPAVDRVDIARSPRVEGEGRLGGLLGLQLDQLRRADIAGLGAGDDRVTFECRANALAHK